MENSAKAANTELVPVKSFPSPLNPASWQWLGLAAALMMICAVFWPGLSGEFIFDDIPTIQDNPLVQIEELNRQSLQQASRAYDGGPIGRPLSTISLAVDWYFHDGEPMGFKLTNLVIHLLNTILIFLLAQRVLRLDPTNNVWPAWAALAFALVWAIHPLQVSTVLYVVQRMEMLAVLFTLLALLCYLQGRVLLIKGAATGWIWILATIPLGSLGFLSKETGILAPLFALCLEAALLRFRASRPIDGLILKFAFATGFTLALFIFAFYLFPGYLDSDRYQRRDFGLLERLLSQLWILPMYFGQIVFPSPDRLTFYYDNLQASRGLFSPILTFAGALFLAGLLGLAWALRKKAPLATLGVLWFFSAHLLTSNVFALELAFEHRNYFALFGVLLVVAEVFRLVSAKISLPAPLLITALVVGLGSITMIRSATWGEPFNLAMHHADINPNSERALLDLGEIYLSMSQGNPTSPFFTSARAVFERVEALERSSPIASQALILMDIDQGREISVERRQIFLEKLANRPVHGPLKAAFDSLVRRRFSGSPVPDELLIEAYEVIAHRPRIPDLVHTRFGFLALEAFEDDHLASQAFGRALELMDDKDREAFLRSLSEAGHDRMADELGRMPRQNQ